MVFFIPKFQGRTQFSCFKAFFFYVKLFLFAISGILDVKSLGGNASHNQSVTHLETQNPFYENPLLHSAHRKHHSEKGEFPV